ncbi:SPOR domain-containing protein [Caloramator sp. mosi_1]|uniref:SPOR domain-containing protein n=1 Tax=Caloramator sp. mosi_1 TaxID=3023090 RepID=UPI002362768D|nr:SPOR domain-containing protein [Caloramator sp. mosi_1]WDC83860.1 SPOR domain-containing protein [Caloramator sp. mosi_1]
MRYTRLELKKNGFSNFELGIIYFVLVIPLVSILVGWCLTQFIILPKLNIKSDSVDMISIKRENKIYLLQIGVFTNETNAKSMVDNLNRIDVYGHYYKDNDTYRVITDVSVDLNIIKNKKEELDKKGISSIIKEFDIQNKIDEKEYYDMNNLIIAQIQLKDGQVSQEQFNKMLKEFYDKYKDDKKIREVCDLLINYQEAIKNNKQDKVIYYIVKSINFFNIDQVKY